MRLLLLLLATFSLSSCKLSQGYQLADAGMGGYGGCLATTRAAQEDVKLADWLHGVAYGADYPELKNAAAATIAAVIAGVGDEAGFKQVVDYLGGMDDAAQKLFVSQGSLNINGRNVKIDIETVEASLLQRFLQYFNDPSITAQEKVEMAKQIHDTSTRAADAIATNRPNWGKRALASLKQMMGGVKNGVMGLVNNNNVNADNRRAMRASQSVMQFALMEADLASGNITPEQALSAAGPLANEIAQLIPANRIDIQQDVASGLYGVEYKVRGMRGNLTQDTGLEAVAKRVMPGNTPALAEIATLEAVRAGAIIADQNPNLARGFVQLAETHAQHQAMGQTDIRQRLATLRSATDSPTYRNVLHEASLTVERAKLGRNEPPHLRARARYQRASGAARL